MTQIVTLPTDRNISNGKNYKGEKFLVHSLKLLAIRDVVITEPIQELAELCVWTGLSRNASRFYATLWVSSCLYYISGYGIAGGYGYCKASAASYGAFRSAGLGLSQDFAGAGMSEVEKAMMALGLSLGYCPKKLYVVQGA